MKYPLCDLLTTIDCEIKRLKKHYTIDSNSEHTPITQIEEIINKHRIK